MTCFVSQCLKIRLTVKTDFCFRLHYPNRMRRELTENLLEIREYVYVYVRKQFLSDSVAIFFVFFIVINVLLKHRR